MGFDPVSFLMGKAAGGGGGGGGGGAWTKLAEQDITFSTTSTSETTVATISAPGIYEAYTSKQKYICVFVRDKAGKRTSHYYGNDWLKLSNIANGQAVYVKSNGSIDYSGSSYGIYGGQISSDDTIKILAKYASNFGSLDGTFHIVIGTMDFPSGVPALYG